MANPYKPPIRLPGPINDILETLGPPGEAVNLMKKGTRVMSDKLAEMNHDYQQADQVVRGIRIGKKRSR